MRGPLIALLMACMLALAATAAAGDEDGQEDADDEYDDAGGADHDQDEDDAEDHDDDHDEGEDDDQDEDRHDAEHDRRSVRVEQDGDSIRFELERESADGEDELEARFDLDDASFSLDHETESGGNETESSLRATFQRVLEYRDSDGDGKYGPGDEVVSAYALGDEDDDRDHDEDVAGGEAEWGQPTIQDISVDGKDGKRIDAPAAIGDGQFALRFYVFGDFVDLENSSLEPTSIKIDIIIDYPYLANDTAVAVLMETRSESEMESDHHDIRADEQGFAAATEAGTHLVFTWKDHADVDGTSQPVETTVLAMKESREVDDDGIERKQERSFALSYPRGDHIVHDPEARLSVVPQSMDTVGVPGPGIVLVAVATLAALALRRR